MRAFYNCVCCDKEIQRHSGCDSVDWQDMWIDGIIGQISGPYGSRQHDGELYVIGICDDCVTKKLEEGKIRYLGNYLHKDYTEKEKLDNPDHKNKYQDQHGNQNAE